MTFLAAPSARLLVGGALLTLAATAAEATTPYEPQVGQAGKDVVWVPTPDDVVDRMLELTQVGPQDRVVDLGSGDGKITIAAAKRGAKAKGIEYNPDMVALSRRNARSAGVNVELVQGDIFKSDFRDATVVTMYLLPDLNERLAPTLLKMKPGTRITSHQFLMGNWKPDRTETVGSREVHFWRVPAQLAGSWTSQIGDGSGPQFKIEQTYQQISGDAAWKSRARAPLQGARVEGTRVSFTLTDAQGVTHHFEGHAVGTGRIQGEVGTAGSAQKLPFSARRL